jgi:hypothetical protein
VLLTVIRNFLFGGQHWYAKVQPPQTLYWSLSSHHPSPILLLMHDVGGHHALQDSPTTGFSTVPSDRVEFNLQRPAAENSTVVSAAVGFIHQPEQTSYECVLDLRCVVHFVCRLGLPTSTLVVSPRTHVIQRTIPVFSSFVSWARYGATVIQENGTFYSFFCSPGGFVPPGNNGVTAWDVIRLSTRYVSATTIPVTCITTIQGVHVCRALRFHCSVD